LGHLRCDFGHLVSPVPGNLNVYDRKTHSYLRTIIVILLSIEVLQFLQGCEVGNAVVHELRELDHCETANE